MPIPLKFTHPHPTHHHRQPSARRRRAPCRRGPPPGRRSPPWTCRRCRRRSGSSGRRSRRPTSSAPRRCLRPRRVCVRGGCGTVGGLWGDGKPRPLLVHAPHQKTRNHTPSPSDPSRTYLLPKNPNPTTTGDGRLRVPGVRVAIPGGERVRALPPRDRVCGAPAGLQVPQLQGRQGGLQAHHPHHRRLFGQPPVRLWRCV